jgi:hypothetical protein
MRSWFLAVACSSLVPLAAQGAPAAAGYVEVDYTKVERTIAKAPDFVAPRYALFVLDLAGKFRVWMVADKSTRDAKHHDVLYVDLNGNGDLTEPGERFTGKYDAKAAAAGMGLTIRVGDIRVPGTDLVHTNFLLSTTPKQDRGGFWFRMNWAGKHEVSGGYGLAGLDTTKWSDSLAKAPIFRPCPVGTLTFATWGDEALEFEAGSSPKINVIVGNAGSGPDTLAVVDENFVDLQKDELLVTVIAKDEKGAVVQQTSRILEHC